MTPAPNLDPDGDGFVIEDLTTGMFASGFGHLGDGRTFAFRVHRGELVVEIYRPGLAGPVPQADDVIAAASRPLGDIDTGDPRSLVAAVRDAVAHADRVR
jgi:hypothetical protein